MAPCASCHGVTRAADKAYPLLEGQARWYLAAQMRVFRAGGRGSIVGEKHPDPMVAIAQKLTAPQIDALADYYAAQSPALKQNFTPERTAQ
jgi:cytochrome c553